MKQKKNSELHKGISLVGIFCIASGAMISSGIFILPGLAFSMTGPSIFISYFLAGILGLLGILSVVELTTAMPKAGGDYYFIKKTFGPLLGTFSGIFSWFALSLKSAFAIFGISEILYLYSGISPMITGLILTVLFVIINSKGTKEAVVFQIILILGLFLLMIIYVVFGIGAVNPDHFSPFLMSGVNGLLGTTSFVFISFGGLINIANLSEEVKNPKRNIPLGMILSVAVVTVFYTLLTFIMTGTLSPQEFSSSLTPVADSAKIFLGTPGYIIIIAASLLAFLTTANGGIISASRYPLALGRDKLLPKLLSRVNGKLKTPIIAITATGILIYLSLLFPLQVLVKAASTVILASFVLTNIAVIVLRESKLVNYQPSFKAPLYPWLQIFSIAVFIFFIIDLGFEAIEISIGLLVLSLLMYLLFGRKVKNRESALLHLMKKITDERLTHHLLEDELLEVLVSRDDIEQDHFDELVKNAVFYEAEHHMDYNDLLQETAGPIAEKTGIDPKKIIKLFTDRQKKSNTALSDFLAIPHIFVHSKVPLFLTIVRCREGIRFTKKENNVKAVFLFGTSEDKRVLHLKTLASIAVLVNLKGFEESWMNARSQVELKNLMIINNRKRFL
jgi:APA family basic amino acid/polyamine antiporter